MGSREKKYQCPVSGLPIFELEAFTNVDFGNGFYVNVRKIGDYIIHSNNRGNMKYSDIARYYKLIEAFIEQANVTKPFIEIRDYENLTGKATRSQKNIQKNYLKDHKDDFAAAIFCNIPDWLRIILSLATILFKASRDTLFICKDYSDAIQKAVDILKNNNKAIDNKLVFDDILCKPEWGFEKDGFKLIAGVIPRKLFYSTFEGKAQADTVIKISQCMNRLFEEGSLTGTAYTRIADYSKLISVPLKTRNAYANFDKPESKVMIGFEQNDDQYKIYVKDNDPGIEKDHLKKIFKMFYRGTEKSTGSGLGLFIENETITSLGGKIKVNSIPGSEIAFTVLLPTLNIK